MKKRLVVMLTLVLFLLPNIIALGITPGRTTIDFSPGLEKSVVFSIMNSESKDLNLVVAAQGDLKDSVSISDNSFSMSASQGAKEVTYNVKLPEKLSPGLHTADVVVVQLPDSFVQTGEASVGASLAVVTQLYVNVPYPGKYAESSLNVIGPESDGTITFVIPIVSKGEFDLVSVKATIDIYSSLNEKVTSIDTNEISVSGQSRGELVAKWDSSEVASGPYRAVATVSYDGDTLTTEKEFSVGQKRLSLEKIEVKDFSLGEIAKFEILVSNQWSETISGAYAEMDVYGSDGNILANFKSPTSDISPLTKKLMVAFWDTKGVKEDVYDSKLFLRYGDQSEQQDLKLEVKEDEINVVGIGYVISEKKSSKGDNSGLIIILIVLVVVLIFINLLWFVFLRKRFRK